MTKQCVSFQNSHGDNTQSHTYMELLGVVQDLPLVQDTYRASKW